MTPQLVPVNELAKQLPPSRGAKQICYPTLWRWIMKGITGPNGERVKLKAIKVGCRWCSTEEWLQQFLERCTPDVGADPAPIRTPKQVNRAAEAAGRELEAMGIH